MSIQHIADIMPKGDDIEERFARYERTRVPWEKRTRPFSLARFFNERFSSRKIATGGWPADTTVVVRTADLEPLLFDVLGLIFSQPGDMVVLWAAQAAWEKDARGADAIELRSLTAVRPYPRVVVPESPWESAAAFIAASRLDLECTPAPADSQPIVSPHG